MMSVYEAHLISTIVDYCPLYELAFVYEAHLISTIVDFYLGWYSIQVYEAHLISTIVDKTCILLNVGRL